MKVLIKKSQKSDFELITIQEFKAMNIASLIFFELVQGSIRRFMVHTKIRGNNASHFKFVKAYSLEHAKWLHSKYEVQSVSYN